MKRLMDFILLLLDTYLKMDLNMMSKEQILIQEKMQKR